MGVRFKLPLYTFVNIENTGLLLMEHEGRKWFPIFTDIENARLYLERDERDARIHFLERPEQIVSLYESTLNAGELFVDHDFVIDPISWDAPEFATMTREDFLSAFRNPPAS